MEKNYNMDSSTLSSIADGSEYDFIIESAEMKPNKTGTGELAVVKARESVSNEEISVFFNIFHENAQTQNISQKEFKKLLRSCGIVNCNLKEINKELAFKKFTATLKEENNYLKVKNYIVKDSTGATPAAEKADNFGF
jgi:hypothetical protein